MATVKLGDRGAEVRRLQTLLTSALRARLKVDGHFGARTQQAVVQLQKMKSLPQDGVVGPKTWAALGQRYSPLPKLERVVAPGDAPWMKVAQDELGVHEDALPGHHNKRIIEYHSTTTLKATTDETPWCSSFVNWAITKAGYRGTNNALARSWLAWGKAADPPRSGAVTVIKKKGAASDQATGSATGFHVGFYVSSTPTAVRLLGGNQSDQVKYSSFSLQSYEVRGYRWPG